VNQREELCNLLLIKAVFFLSGVGFLGDLEVPIGVFVIRLLFLGQALCFGRHVIFPSAYLYGCQ
jgi:hypothetical protein